MSLLLEIPEDDLELKNWLGQILVSNQFSDYVGQLTYLNKVRLEQGDSAVEPISDDRLSEFSRLGLFDATAGECKRLLRNPSSMVQLNEAIFTEGADVWMNELPKASDEDLDILKQVGDQWTENLQPTEANSIPVQPKVSPATSRATETSRPTAHSRFPTRRGWLAMAASVLIAGFGVYWLQSGSADDWGWMNAQAMPQDVSEKEYLESIGNSALEWFDLSQRNRLTVSKNLSTLSEGCSRLIQSDHAPLQPENRDWLIEKCRAWQETIDQLVVQSNDPNVDLSSLKNQADDLVARIAKVLEDRASQI